MPSTRPFLLVTALLAGALVAPVVAQTSTQTASRAIQRPSQKKSYPGASTSALSIANERSRQYPGSVFTLRQTLSSGRNYSRQVVSYQSDGLRINALLTVPDGTPPAGGWPAIVFNHGYIPPEQYRTTEKYVAYQDAFARAGFVTLKSDYRGHGSSQGQALGGYYDPGYTDDVLNALGSLKQDKRVNPARIGMWGHSMGGHLTLRALVIDPADIKAAVIWAGVTAPYSLIQTGWKRGPNAEYIPPSARVKGKELIARYGTAAQDPAFWQAVSPNSYLSSIQAPIQLHQGTSDAEVPQSFRVALEQGLKAAGKPYTTYIYPGDDHNISRHLSLALSRSVAFFKAHL